MAGAVIQVICIGNLFIYQPYLTGQEVQNYVTLQY